MAKKTITINASDLAHRMNMAGYLGQQYGGFRDVYASAGYGKTITFQEYKARYERQDIATRIVDAPAEESWRNPPELLDGANLEEAKDGTPFVKAWQELLSVDTAGAELEDRKTIWHYLQRVDRLAGIGRYGGLLLGLNDGLELKEPIKAKSVSGPQGFLYLSALDEGDLDVVALDEDKTSRRYGLPLTYRVQLGTSLEGASVGGATSADVHWSRIIHVAEDLQADEVYGTPRLRPIWNRLIDLEKILAGSGESAWRLMYKGMILSTKDGYKLTDDEVTQAKIDEFVHGMTRVVQLEGMDVHDMGGQIVDPTGVATLNVAFISSATGIPQRILLGSERAELASTQDEQNWARIIATRCQNFAEPQILRPLVNRLIFAGVLPPPASKKYAVKWPPFAEPDPKTDSLVAKQYAEALEKAVGITKQTIDLKTFLEAYMRDLSAAKVVDVEVEPVVEPGAPGEPTGAPGDAAQAGSKDVAQQEEAGDDGDAKADIRANIEKQLNAYWSDKIWEQYPGLGGESADGRAEGAEEEA